MHMRHVDAHFTSILSVPGLLESASDMFVEMPVQFEVEGSAGCCRNNLGFSLLVYDSPVRVARKARVGFI
eukprot:3790964-Amphidinium_carterae.1